MRKPACFVLVTALAAVTPAISEENKSAFLQPPALAGQATPDHAVTNRAFQGISSMAVSPGGRLWVIWYAGETPGEDQNNYVVLSTSGDGGKTWTEALVVDPDGPGPVRAFDPEIWISPDGKLRIFWAQAIGHDGTVSGTWMMDTADVESASPEWSKPVRITDGIMMCKPIALANGEWLAPISTWWIEGSARLAVSRDEGSSWTFRGKANVPAEHRTFDEHMFVERKDGSLWMLVRTKYGIGESISTDGGATWPEVTPSSISHPPARFFIKRLASGNLLLVKHGPLDKQSGRSHLTAYISKDDGKTWEGGFVFDERNGVSYPDGQQGSDGTIYITYDFDRTGEREIYFAAFREEDAAAGRAVSDAVQLRQVVSKASGGRALQALHEHADGEKLRTEKPGAWQGEGMPAAPLSYGKLFSDRDYSATEVPDALKKARVLTTSLKGEKSVTCSKAGTLYFLTPAPDRNKDSQSQMLESQGFRKVALPEFLLFSPVAYQNCVTLYQKDCEAGEVIKFGQWAVPVFLP